jgi:hypothetical protein
MYSERPISVPLQDPLTVDQHVAIPEKPERFLRRCLFLMPRMLGLPKKTQRKRELEEFLTLLTAYVYSDAYFLLNVIGAVVQCWYL